MFEKHMTSGFDIYQPFQGIDQWVVDFKNGQAFHGTFKEIAFYLVKNFDVLTSEIEFAVEVMCRNDHNAAHFGAMNKTFIFSFDKVINVDKKAS
jgi:hypothetical protein